MRKACILLRKLLVLIVKFEIICNHLTISREWTSLEERLNRVKQQLQQSSYKLTPQREATVRVLIENEKDHLSAEDDISESKRQSA